MTETPTVIVGDTFRHYKGGLYRLICMSRDANDGTPCAVYQDIGTGRIYHRSVLEFTESVDWHEYVMVSEGGILRQNQVPVRVARFRRIS